MQCLDVNSTTRIGGHPLIIQDNTQEVAANNSVSMAAWQNQSTVSHHPFEDSHIRHSMNYSNHLVTGDYIELIQHHWFSNVNIHSAIIQNQNQKHRTDKLSTSFDWKGLIRGNLPSPLYVSPSTRSAMPLTTKSTEPLRISENSIPRQQTQTVVRSQPQSKFTNTDPSHYIKLQTTSQRYRESAKMVEAIEQEAFEKFNYNSDFKQCANIPNINETKLQNFHSNHATTDAIEVDDYHQAIGLAYDSSTGILSQCISGQQELLERGNIPENKSKLDPIGHPPPPPQLNRHARPHNRQQSNPQELYQHKSESSVPLSAAPKGVSFKPPKIHTMLLDCSILNQHGSNSDETKQPEEHPEFKYEELFHQPSYSHGTQQNPQQMPREQSSGKNDEHDVVAPVQEFCTTGNGCLPNSSRKTSIINNEGSLVNNNSEIFNTNFCCLKRKHGSVGGDTTNIPSSASHLPHSSVNTGQPAHSSLHSHHDLNRVHHNHNDKDELAPQSIDNHNDHHHSEHQENYNDNNDGESELKTSPIILDIKIPLVDVNVDKLERIPSAQLVRHLEASSTSA